MILKISNTFSTLPIFTIITYKTTHIKSTNLYPTKIHFNTSKFHSGISSNMWWTDIKATIGQRLNSQGIISSTKIITNDQNLALPHLIVPDIRHVNWVELKKKGFNGVVFDKDNTLTIPYKLTLWEPLKSSLEQCKATFGEDNVAVFSNTAGLYEFDNDGSKAKELEREIGVRVVRHKVKKPNGSGEEIEKHFGFSSSSLVMVGDRVFTDVVYGNRNGFFTILTKPFCLVEEPFVVRQVRKFEGCFLKMLCKKGLKPKMHCLVGDGYFGLVNDQPSN